MKKQIQPKFFLSNWDLGAYRNSLYSGKQLDEEFSLRDDFDCFLKGVQRLLESCYYFGINPLPQLRKLFPGLEWIYVNQEDGGEVKSIVRAIDPEYIFSLDVSDSVVCARKKGHNTKSLFKIFVPSEDDEDYFKDGNDKPIKRFESLGYATLQTLT